MSFLGKTLLLARKALEISGRIPGEIWEKFVSDFESFCGNFVQHKGGANKNTITKGVKTLHPFNLLAPLL